MKSYRWILPADKAFALSEQLSDCALFEGEGHMWCVEWLCMDSAQEAILAQYPAYEKVELEETDWLAQSASAVKPLSAGDFYIHSGAYPASERHSFSLKIEATLAFGSGHHETTQGCLYLIQTVWKNHPWTRALDLGCGSGILTLAMNALNPGSAIGIDYDEQAIVVAQDNAHHNAIACAFMVADVMTLKWPCVQLIVANLFAPLLMVLAPQMTDGQARHLILSGILCTQVQEVVKTYGSLGWQLTQPYSLGAWTSMWFSRAACDH